MSTPSNEWARTLPRGPLTSLLAAQHALFLMHSPSEQTLEVFEEYGRRIAVYSQFQPGHPEWRPSGGVGHQ